MRLFLDVGHHDRSVKRSAPAGSCLAAVADGAAEIGLGVLLVCAEGVPGRPDGGSAARAVTTALGDAYYSAADGCSPVEMLQEGLRSANQAVRVTGERGRAAAVTALVLIGRHWHTAHAGHIRAYRFRDLQIKQLTRDHLIPRAPRQTEVTRACGYADSMDPDYDDGELKEGDIFLLTSPGVHDVLAGAALLGVLQSDQTAQQMAEALVHQALAAHTPTYAAACVARVEKLPSKTAAARGSLAPLAQLPRTGTEVDDFVIEKLILKSRRFRLYKALDRESEEKVILRFPDPSYPASAQTFLREESISRRIESPYILPPIALRPGRRTALYSVIEYRKAESIAKRIRRKQGLRPREALRFGDQLLAAIEILHRQGVIHGDIRPHNLLYDKHEHRLYVFGLLANATKAAESTPSGSLSYRAPELLNDGVATERSDVYAAGVTIYRMLTGEYPYGKIHTGTDWSQLLYTSIVQYREELPGALDDVLARACALNPADRYAGVAPFAAALSAVQVAAPMLSRTTTMPKSDQRASSRRAWGIAAGLLAALLAYLYIALR